MEKDTLNKLVVEIGKNKGGQVQYAWLFSLIIGAAIIFLAVFAASKFSKTGGVQSQAELVRQFDILLNPFVGVGSETSISLSKVVEMPNEVQISFTCNSGEGFNEVNIRERKGKGYGDWLDNGYRIRDKYIFSENLSGKNFYVFSKPFEVPWKVDDLIYITSRTYCFDSPPEEVEREVKSLRTNAAVVKDSRGCPDGSITVCFEKSGCDVNVKYDSGVLSKKGKSVLFSNNAMMYAGIFSDAETYKCGFERLNSRLKVQAKINLGQALLLESKGCDTDGLQISLNTMLKALGSGSINGIKNIAGEVEDRNPKECPVF